MLIVVASSLAGGLAEREGREAGVIPQSRAGTKSKENHKKSSRMSGTLKIPGFYQNLWYRLNLKPPPENLVQSNAQCPPSSPDTSRST